MDMKIDKTKTRRGEFQFFKRWQDVFKAFQRRVLALVGLVIFTLLLLSAALAPVLSKHNPTKQNLMNSMRPPVWMEDGSTENILGTDDLGRDTLSRLLYGARVSLSAAGLASLFSMIFGVTLGLLAGYFGSWVETILMRLVEVFYSLPMILLALALSSILGPSFRNVILVMGLTGWMVYAKTTAIAVKGLKNRDFVTAAVCNGVPVARILYKHILPNVIAPALVLFTFGFAQFIILESALGFLGLGVPPPLPTWGRMLYDARAFMASSPWLMMEPGICILLTTLSLNFIGDGLRDALDPKLRNITNL